MATDAETLAIAEQLRPLATALDSLTLLGINPRRGDVSAVARSLSRFGQRKPVVVRRADRVVVAGNHTVLAARELGWQQLAAVFVDEDESVSKAYALADNQTSTLGGYDVGDMATLVAELHELDPTLLAAASFDDEAIAKLIGVPMFDEDDDQPQLDEKAQIECPACGHAFDKP